MQRGGVGLQTGEGLQELEDPFALDPIADAEQRGAPAVPQVPRVDLPRSDVAAGRHDADAPAVEPCGGELVGEVVARDEEQAGVAPGKAVKRGLRHRPHAAVVNAAGRLVEGADQRRCLGAARKQRGGEGGGDAVDQDGVRAEVPDAPQHALCRERRQRERTLWERDEYDARAVAWRGGRHPKVVEVTPGEPLWVAESHDAEEQMRVVHVAPTPFGAGGIFGGGERYPLELARALARRVDCELVTFGSPARRMRELDGLAVTVLRPFMHLGHPAHPIAAGLPGAVAGADLIHTHHLRSAPSRMAALLARARGIPAVTTDHGLPGGTWAGLLLRLFERFLTVSEYSARQVGAPPSRTRVIYGGVDCVRFRPDADAPRDGILFVGRLTPHKGVDRLIAALPEDARLTVAGTGGHDPEPPERNYPQLLRRLARGRSVRFLGAVPDDDLPRLYRQAAVFALPSVQRTCYGRDIAVVELLGLTVLEAMASSTPVVCSRVGGLAEIVDDGVTGFLVEPGDVDELRGRLDQLLRDRPLAARLGRNARDRALERFTWNACAERCLAVYAELLDGAAPTGPL